MQSILQLPSEAKVRSQLRRILFPEGLRCPDPACGSTVVNPVKGEGRYYCCWCKKRFSLTSVHPLLRHMRISLRQFYLLLWCWQKKFSPGHAREVSGLSHVTVTRWYDRCRLYLPNLEDYSPLCGIVEGDESQFGHTYHATDQWVAGAVERHNHRNVRLQPIEARDSGNLDRFILENVKPDSLLVTDGYSAYYGMENFHGLAHEIGNHSKGNFGPTAMAENIWSRCDRFLIRVYHQVRKARLPQILKELQARFSKPELFENPNNYLRFALCAVPLSC